MPRQRVNTERITIRLTENLYQEIARLATLYKYRSVSDFIRTTLQGIAIREREVSEG